MNKQILISLLMGLFFNLKAQNWEIRAMNEANNEWPHIATYVINKSSQGEHVDGYKIKYFFQHDYDREHLVPTLFYDYPENRAKIVKYPNCIGGSYNDEHCYSIDFELKGYIGAGNRGYGGNEFKAGLIAGEDFFRSQGLKDIAYSKLASTYTTNNTMAFYSNDGVLLAGTVPPWAQTTNTEVVWDGKGSGTNNDDIGSGSGRVAFEFRDGVSNLESKQQVTIKLRLKNIGTSRMVLEKGDYYRYYFEQENVYYKNSWIGPRVDAYWPDYLNEETSVIGANGKNVQLENCGGNKWSVKYFVPKNVSISSGRYYPSSDGSAVDIRLNHYNWPPYLTKEGFSYIKTSTFEKNPKIFYFDSDKNLKWNDGNTPPFICEGESFTPTEEVDEENVPPCEITVSSSVGGSVVDEGVRVINENPEFVSLEAYEDAGFSFVEWRVNGDGSVNDANTKTTEAALKCNDEVEAKFELTPVNNFHIENECLSESAQLDCEATGSASTGIKNVWVQNDEHNVFFLFEFCNSNSWESDQFLYLDLIPEGESVEDDDGFDSRYRIDYHRSGEKSDKSMNMCHEARVELFDYNDNLGRETWECYRENSPNLWGPIFDLNHSIENGTSEDPGEGSQALPNGTTGLEGTLVELSVPITQNVNNVIKWWLDGASDDVGSRSNPQEYHLTKSVDIEIDGYTSDWVSTISELNENRSSAELAYSSAMQSSSVATSSSSSSVGSSSSVSSSSSSVIPIVGCETSQGCSMVNFNFEAELTIEVDRKTRLNLTSMDCGGSWCENLNIKVNISTQHPKFDLSVKFGSDPQIFISDYSKQLLGPSKASVNEPYFIEIENLANEPKVLTVKWWYQ